MPPPAHPESDNEAMYNDDNDNECVVSTLAIKYESRILYIHEVLVSSDHFRHSALDTIYRFSMI